MTSAPPVRRAPGRRVLTAVEFDVLWEWLGLGATPVVLRLDSPGRTHAERRRIVNAGWQGLRERGLATLTGPDPEIVRLMHLLAAPTRQVELRMRPGQESRLGHELRVVAAGRSGAATLAVRQDATVALSSVALPVAGVLGTLPAIRAGAGRSVTLPSADLEVAVSASEHGYQLGEVLVRRGVPADDAELIQAILQGATGRGQLSVLAADNWGVLHRLPKVIGVLDTRHGRYQIGRETANDGAEWTTLAPTDPVRLRHRMDELLAEAAAHANRI
jgi:hypothetical protein